MSSIVCRQEQQRRGQLERDRPRSYKEVPLRTFPFPPHTPIGKSDSSVLIRVAGLALRDPNHPIDGPRSNRLRHLNQQPARSHDANGRSAVLVPDNASHDSTTFCLHCMSLLWTLPGIHVHIFLTKSMHRQIALRITKWVIERTLRLHRTSPPLDKRQQKRV